MEEIIRELEKKTTLSRADILAAVRGLTEITASKLANGKTVRLDGMGSFRVTLESRTQTGDTKITGASIERKRLLLLRETCLNEC